MHVLSFFLLNVFPAHTWSFLLQPPFYAVHVLEKHFLVVGPLHGLMEISIFNLIIQHEGRRRGKIVDAWWSSSTKTLFPSRASIQIVAGIHRHRIEFTQFKRVYLSYYSVGNNKNWRWVRSSWLYSIKSVIMCLFWSLNNPRLEVILI